MTISIKHIFKGRGTTVKRRITSGRFGKKKLFHLQKSRDFRALLRNMAESVKKNPMHQAQWKRDKADPNFRDMLEFGKRNKLHQHRDEQAGRVREVRRNKALINPSSPQYSSEHLKSYMSSKARVAYVRQQANMRRKRWWDTRQSARMRRARA